MGAIANKVLSDLGYDPTYNAGRGASNHTTGIPMANKPQDNFLGNVFNSIRSGVQAVPGMVGGEVNRTAGLFNTVGKGIAQYAPNVLFGQNTTTNKNGQGGGYIPGLANLVAPQLSSVFKMQADANSRALHEGKSTALDDFFATPTAQLADANKVTNNTIGELKDARRKLDTGQISKGQFDAVVKGVQMRQGMNSQNIQDIGKNIIDPKEFNMALAEVASMPFAFGKFQGVGKAGSALSLAEKALGASKEVQPFLPTGARDIAATLLKAPLKQTLINKPNVDSAMTIPGQIQEGKYKDAALNAGSFFVPAGLAVGKKVATGASNFVGKNIFDTSGVFDKIILKSGNTVNKEIRAFAKEAAQVGPDNPKLVRKATQMENKLRQLQDLALQENNGNHKLAAQALEAYQSSERKFSKMDLEQFVKEATRHFEARLETQKLAKAGAFGEQFINGKGVTVGRLTKDDKTAIVERLKNSDDMVKEVRLMRKEGLIKNDNLYGELQDMVKGGNKKYAIDSAKQLTASKKLPGALEFKNGYFSTYSRGAGVVKGQASETAKLVQGKEAKLGFIGNAIRKAGLSPEQMTAEDNRAAFNKFKTAFESKIDGIGDRSSKSLYKDLNNLAGNTPGVTDIRQLTSRKIASELNLTTQQAKQILKASKDSYKVLSTAERGLAGKLMDFNLRVNPIAAPYSRVQSLARYEANPFFRLQENVETRTGLAALGGKNVMPRTTKYDETIKKLNGKNGIFTSGYGGEGADSFAGSFSGVGAKISRDQESNIAASIEKFAGGPQNVDSWLKNPKNAGLLNDIKTVVQYPDKGFTSSNLAKMMNLVSFPSRYNLKVTGFAVKQLAKQPAMTQVAIIRGLGDFNDFVKSPEGVKWQADNKEVIGFLKYLTPIMPIASVYQTVSGQNKTLMDTGMMGGLPFGIISRVLQGQGVLKDRVPYVDPRTGKVYSDKIPQDLKAKTQSFLESVVDTLYTYPGRTAGAETSKKQLTQGAVENLTFGYTKGGKYSEVDRSKDVTPEQQRQIDILKSRNSVPQFTKQAPPGNIVNTKRPDKIVPKPIYKAAKAKKAKVKNYGKPIASFL